MIVLFNILVLGSLFLLLIVQESRYRRFRRRVAAVRGNLLSLVAQMRTPLGTLRKYSHMLQKKELGSLSVAQAEALSKMENGREDLMLRFNRFLAASRLEEAEIALKPVRVNLAESVQAALESVAAHTEKRKIAVRITGGRSISIVADPLLLHGILDELLLNAVLYSPKKSSITVAIVGKKTKAEIHIRDTGIGITEGEAAHVFEKFFRGDRARVMADGNGLGLYFAKQFTQAIGGTLTFMSKLNSGATFTLSLPKRG